MARGEVRVGERHDRPDDHGRLGDVGGEGDAQQQVDGVARETVEAGLRRRGGGGGARPHAVAAVEEVVDGPGGWHLRFHLSQEDVRVGGTQETGDAVPHRPDPARRRCRPSRVVVGGVVARNRQLLGAETRPPLRHAVEEGDVVRRPVRHGEAVDGVRQPQVARRLHHLQQEGRGVERQELARVHVRHHGTHGRRGEVPQAHLPLPHLGGRQRRICVGSTTVSPAVSPRHVSARRRKGERAIRTSPVAHTSPSEHRSSTWPRAPPTRASRWRICSVKRPPVPAEF